MKKLKFLVMTENITPDYAKAILKGIFSYCRKNDIDCLVCNVRHPQFGYGLYEYQFWAGSSLINTSEVDVLIVLSGLYCSTFAPQRLSQILSAFEGKKIISISQRLDMDNAYTIYADNEKIYEEAFDFLINKAGSKRIAFMSANRTSSVESLLRYGAYRKCLEKYGMEYDDSIVFHSDFIDTSAYEELSHQLVNLDGVPDFDTLICANDQMAFGAIRYFKDHGIRVPEDVRVMGYDDIEECVLMNPSLTSINPHNFAIGEKAAELGLRLASGEEIESVTVVPAILSVRNSTGYGFCQGASDFGMNEIAIESMDNTSIYFLLDFLQANESLNSLFMKFPKVFEGVGINRVAICLYENPVVLRKNGTFRMPEKVRLAYVLDHKKSNIFYDSFFNPNDCILPADVFESSCDCYVVQSVFYGEKQYGYMVFSVGDRGLSFYNIHEKIVSNAICASFEFTKQFIQNLELEVQNKLLETKSKTDEMTGVLNRRGFMNQGQHQINYAIEVEAYGVVIYGDMNHLKMINDVYGHEAGDNAIKAEAEILKKTFRTTDSIGRMGGDEFAIVATGLPLSKMAIIEEKLRVNCEEVNKKYNFPFNISISIGAVEITSDKCELEELLALADEQQYVAKRAFHEREKPSQGESAS